MPLPLAQIPTQGAAVAASETGAPVPIAVQFGELSALARTLRSLQGEMEQPHGTLTAGFDDVVAAALTAAEADWTGQRRKLAAFFSTMADGVQASAEAYRQADSIVPPSHGGRS